MGCGDDLLRGVGQVEHLARHNAIGDPQHGGVGRACVEVECRQIDVAGDQLQVIEVPPVIERDGRTRLPGQVEEVLPRPDVWQIGPGQRLRRQIG